MIYQRTRGHLPPVLFSTAVGDPNWGYDQFGLAKHGAARSKYDGSPASSIGRIPVGEWTSRNSNLFLWGTGPKIEAAIDVQRAWGYHVVTMIPWVKTVPTRGEIKRGVGFWGYSAAEYLLCCRRGNASAPRYRSMSDKPMMLLCGPRDNPVFYQKRLHDQLADEDLTSLAPAAFYEKLGPHSRKPLSLYGWIESYFPGRYLELFARDTRVGWTCVGHGTGWHMDETGVVPYMTAVREARVVPEEALLKRHKEQEDTIGRDLRRIHGFTAIVTHAGDQVRWDLFKPGGGRSVVWGFSPSRDKAWSALREEARKRKND